MVWTYNHASRAAGLIGAIAKGTREVKAEVLKPRQRTFGTEINVVRVNGGS